MDTIKLGYDYGIWREYQIKWAVQADLRSHPSLLLTGASGSGKSYALKYLIDNLLQHNVDMTFCNFKNSEDFKFLQGCEKYFTFTSCGKGLEAFYNQFKEIQGSDIEFDGCFKILVFDEFPAFILFTLAQDKKLAESYKMMISEVLMIGRGYGVGLLLVTQRPDSAFFQNGARDNFFIKIMLGNPSKEAKGMLYSGEELPKRIYKAGEGICYIDGVGLKEVKFPRISDMALLEERILNRLTGRPEGVPGSR